MKNKKVVYCTYFDKNYLILGLALYSSLLKHNPGSELWVLCMDDYAARILDSMKLEGLKTIKLQDFEDNLLKKAKRNRSEVEYYWTCTPFLPLYIFSKSASTTHIVYIDADCYFFSNISPAFQELGNKSIFVQEHRYPKGEKYRSEKNGRFNVSFLIFRKSNESIRSLIRWRAQCAKWCFDKIENGKYGDQKYLDEWPKLYKQLVISKNVGINTAPWNISQYKISSKDKKIYINDNQLICYHFHQFRIMNNGSFNYVSGYRLSKKVKKYIYDTYVTDIRKYLKIVKSIDPEYNVNLPNIGYKIKLRNYISKYFGSIIWDLMEHLNESKKYHKNN